MLSVTINRMKLLKLIFMNMHGLCKKVLENEQSSIMYSELSTRWIAGQCGASLHECYGDLHEFPCLKQCSVSQKVGILSILASLHMKWD